jgi:hypothetical protein
MRFLFVYAGSGVCLLQEVILSAAAEVEEAIESAVAVGED